MKKILFTALAFVLIASPALAVECPEGEVFQSETTYEQGECTAYSTPVCLQTEPVCNWWGPFHIICWGGWTNQCVEYSEPVCTEYEQVAVEGGMCVPSEESDDPSDEEPTDETATSTPRIIGGLVHYNKPLIANVSFTLEGDEIVANVLTTKPMTCGIITSDESQQFAVSSDSTPIGNNDMELFGSVDELYGYSEMYLGNAEPQTFSTVTAPRANYFRILCDYFGKPIVSTEYTTLD